MLRNILIGGVLLLPLFFSACESAEERADRRAINRTTDSLAATGQHGYYVATYIEGRYKNTRIEKLPFQVMVHRMDIPLHGVPIHVQLQEGGYQLRYAAPGGEVNVTVTGNGVVKTPDMDMELTLPDGADHTFLMRHMAYIGYVLKVYPY